MFVSALAAYDTSEQVNEYCCSSISTLIDLGIICMFEDYLETAKKHIPRLQDKS